MNAIFLTQSTSLGMFFRLMEALREPLGLERVGFYVTDSVEYERFAHNCPEIESGEYRVLKEWEILRAASGREPDMELIRSYESEIGDPDLWGAVVCDRWLSLGRRCIYRQDYGRRYTHGELLAILSEGLLRIDRFLDEVKPHVIFSFICVTFGEYITYLMSRLRGIPFLNLRPTRIRDFVVFAEGIFEPSRYLVDRYCDYRKGRGGERWLREAVQYIDSVRTGHAMYEGVIPPSRRAPRVVKSGRSLYSRTMDKLRHTGGYLMGRYRNDNQYPGVWSPLLYRSFINPLRGAYTNAVLRKHHLTERDLDGMEYVFYPLHKEPEVTMMVYSRRYLNQVEVVRNFASSIPVGMKLVVKEHPASVGWRSPGFYRKLLDIPNVCIAEPSIVSKRLIENARLVAITAGSIGLESLLLGKPVVSLGNCPFNILPDSMIRNVKILEGLGEEVSALLNGYSYDEGAMKSYVAAVMDCGTRVNLYSMLLGKRGVYSVDPAPVGIEDEIGKLAKYAVRRVREESAAQGVGSGEWKTGSR